MKYTFINANTDFGLHIDGTNQGPELITKNFKEHKIISLDKNNKYQKDKNKNNLAKNLNAINDFNTLLFNTVTDVLKNGDFPITVGGDHSIAIASALASNKYHNNLGIIWIDAHTDYNTFKSTVTGNIHGLPLAAINGYQNELLTNFLTNNYINPKNTVIIGARSIDKLELENLKNNNITYFTTEDIKKEGINNILDKAFKIAAQDTSGIHISYDLDYIDPLVCPGVSVPEEQGIDIDTALNTMKYLYNKKDIIKSLDLVEYNPLLDKNNETLNIAIDLLKIFINKK